MFNKNFDEYLRTITPTNRTIKSFIGIQRVMKSYDTFKNDLQNLNKVIDLDENKLKQNIRNLFNENPQSFTCLLELIAISDDKTTILKDGVPISIKNLLNSVDDVILIFQESGLIGLITSGTLTSFNNYFLGVMVGMDTHARKNRAGSSVEDSLYDNLKSVFLYNKNVTIKKEEFFFKNFYTDSNIETLRNKKLDIIIEDNKNNHIYIIESSFYNTSGSKVSETAKSYFNVYNITKDIPNITFIWVADGKGIMSIKSYLAEIFDCGFILNINQFNKWAQKLNHKIK